MQEQLLEHYEKYTNAQLQSEKDLIEQLVLEGKPVLFKFGRLSIIQDLLN